MTDLDTRLATMRQAPQPPGLDVTALRARARARTRRRQVMAGTAVVMVVLVGILAAVALDRRDAEHVDIGPADTAPPAPPVPVWTIGDVEGITVTVAPGRDLEDRAVVEVRITGLERLPRASLKWCVNAVTPNGTLPRCDSTAMEEDGSRIQGHRSAAPVQRLRLERVLFDSPSLGGMELDPDERPYDCAREAAGCVLAVVGGDLPTRALLVPLTFVDLPDVPPHLAAAPLSDLVEGQLVSIEAEGMAPGSSYGVAQCREDRTTCYSLRQAGGITDADGRGRTTFEVRTSMYTAAGRTDCTVEVCILRVSQTGGPELVTGRITFAGDVVASTPTITLDPPGPYTDGQAVTVFGTGFPPSTSWFGRIVQCPAGHDPAFAALCPSPEAPAYAGVAEDGTFSTVITLAAKPSYLAWVDSAAWAAPLGPPLTFTR